MRPVGHRVVAEQPVPLDDRGLHQLGERLRRRAEVGDAGAPEAWWDGRPFDRILADVPCTAEGRIDLSDPRSFTFWSQKNITEHAKLQRRLLRSAFKMLKPGGTLVYSTCTLAPEENEEQMKWFVEEHPSLKIEPITLPVSPVRPTKYGTIILPSADCEGFFVAKLKRME